MFYSLVIWDNAPVRAHTTPPHEKKKKIRQVAKETCVNSEYRHISGLSPYIPSRIPITHHCGTIAPMHCINLGLKRADWQSKLCVYIIFQT